MRGFHIAKGWEDKQINLPTRATIKSAGYDFEAAETIIIPGLFSRLARLIDYQNLSLDLTFLKPILIPTGIKVDMQDDEVLLVYNRSGNPLKKLLLLANGVGAIDADYYNNIDNDGHIHFPFWCLGLNDVTIEKGDRIGQGIFSKFLIARNELMTPVTKKRLGGLGHTGD